MDIGRVMTLREVAKYLRVHPNTVYRLASRRKLPAFKVGSDWRFNRESIDRWRLSQEQAVNQTRRAGLVAQVLDILYWYQSEGLQTSISFEDIRLFLDCDPQLIRAAFNELGRAGLVEQLASGQFHLTATGMAQWDRTCRRSAARPPGHAAVLVQTASPRKENL